MSFRSSGGYNVNIKRAELVVDLFTEVYLVPKLWDNGETLVHWAGGGNGGCRHWQPVAPRGHTRGHTRGRESPGLAGGGWETHWRHGGGDRAGLPVVSQRDGGWRAVDAAARR